MPPSNGIIGNPASCGRGNRDGDDGSDSEESALIVWEDGTDGRADLRHLLPRGANAMTQQIEEMSDSATEDDDDDDEEEEEKEGDDGVRVEGRGGRGDGADARGSRGSGDANSRGDDAGGLKAGSTLGTQPHDNNESHTPPPVASDGDKPRRSNRLMNSGEEPATISKLKRRKRRVKADQSKGGKSAGLPTIDENAIDSAGEKGKRKLSAGQEVERVYDFLGVPNANGKPSSSSENRSLSQSQTMENINQELLPHPSSHSDRGSPMGQRKLSFQNALGNSGGGGRTHRRGLGLQRSHTHPPVHQGQQRKRIKLPPLKGRHCLSNNDANELEKENDGNAKNGNDAETGSSEEEESGRNLFAEIEMGLDRVICEKNQSLGKNDVGSGKAAVVSASMPDAAASAAAVGNEIRRWTAGAEATSIAGGSVTKAMPDARKSTIAVKEDVSNGASNGNFRAPAIVASSSMVPSSTRIASSSVKPERIASSTCNEIGASSVKREAIPTKVGSSFVEQLMIPTKYGHNAAKEPKKEERSDSNNDEFGDDDDWDADDLAAIDLMTQSHTQPTAPARSSLGPSYQSKQRRQPLKRHSAPFSTAPAPTFQRHASLPAATSSSPIPRRSASLTVAPSASTANRGNALIDPQNEFDDDDEWNDEDLAAIDLSVAMTQSHSVGSANPAPSVVSAPAPAPDNYAATLNSFDNPPDVANGRSEFSDDDDDAFAQVDFSALDDRITQHQLMTQQFSSDLPPTPPPPDAPVRNRRRDHGAGARPTFLSFTRYVVRSVHNYEAMFTKTIGVSLWKPSGEENGKRDELERLKKMFGDGDGASDGGKVGTGPVDGYMHLRGEWQFTDFHIGDDLHLCSLSGSYFTDPSALPTVLHSHPPAGSDTSDDLLLVAHPDEMISPTLVSEAVKCPRLAVLQSRLGSTGLSAKSAVIGTLRHDLFERCLRERDASRRSAALFTRRILRDNAAALMGCGMADSREAFGEVVKTIPQIQKFLDTYTNWDATRAKQKRQRSGVASCGGSRSPTAVLNGMFPPGDTLLSMEGVYSTEEWAHVPELGLKGSVDATVMARTKPLDPSSASSQGMQDALMPIELKTGHVQNPSHNHLAQLSTYTVMLRARHGSVSPAACVGFRPSNSDDSKDSLLDGMEDAGARSSGMLLYLNHESYCAKHVKPSMSDIKTLIGQRNLVACDVLRAARPRGLTIEYEGDEGRNGAGGGGGGGSKVVVKDPPLSALPHLNSSIGTCERCYKNRECMMYASADDALEPTSAGANNKHGRLMHHFTGHLDGVDLEYFRKWDRLIDLERHASARDVVSRSWLFESGEREARDGRCVSSVVLDEAALAATGGNETATKGPSAGGDDDVPVRFIRSSDSDRRVPLTSLSLEVGSYVIVSEDGTSCTQQHHREVTRRKRMYILRGSVLTIDERSIGVAVPKKDLGRLKRHLRGGNSNIGPSVKFRLDKDEFGNSAGLLLQNLVNFFTLDIPPFSAESMGTPAKTKSLTADTECSVRRRRTNSSIVRLDPPPRFDNVSAGALFARDALALEAPGCDRGSLRRDFVRLNLDQRNAVLKCASARDFALVQGLPGTGKSATIAFVTRLLVSRGMRVLLTSYTHSAVDNLLCKLMDSGVVSSDGSGAPSPIVRIGRESACHCKVRPLLAQNIACEAETRDSGGSSSSSVEKPSVEHLHKVVSAAKVVGVSALTAPRSPLLAGQRFDVVIVDEAGQISQPAVLGAIMAADSFVLVGDHMQLPPLVVSDVAEEAGYGISMLMHLAEGFPDAVAQLTMQYRMNEDICHLSNIIAYKGLLKCGNDSVRHQKLDLPKKLDMVNPIDRPWIERAIDPNHPVVFLDTDGRGWLESDGVRTGAGGLINDAEASIVEKLVLSMSICGVENSSIGVITPFRSQLRLLNDSLALRESKTHGLEMCTIDRFQGRDKPVIIVSLVRSNREGKAGRLLQDFRRLNVAFSRAKEKMIVVGSYSTLHGGSDVMRPVLDSLRQRNWIHKLLPV